MADEVDDWQSAPTPETDDWQQAAQPAVAAQSSEVDDWQAAPAPSDDWQPAPLPKAESPFWSGVRKFAHGIGPTLAGAAAGAATVGGYGALAGSVAALPGPGTVGGLLIGGAAGLVTGGVSGYLASEAQEAAAKALNFDDSLQQAANEQANPGSTLIGGALTAAVPFGMGRGVVTLGQRAFSGALMGGVETGSELAEGKPFDPAAIALNVGMGAAFPRPRKFLTPFESAGARVGARVGARLSGAPAVAPHGTPGSDAAAGTAKEQPQPAGGTPVEPGAAPATPEAVAPGGDRGGPEDYGKEAQEQVPDPLDVLDRERAEVGHDPTNPLSRALEDVTSVALPGADELIPSFHWALENGRPDIAEAIVRRLEARVKERAQNPPPPVDPSSSFAPHAERLAQEARQEEAITANLRRAIAKHATNTDPALDAAIRAKMEPEGEAAAPPPGQEPAAPAIPATPSVAAEQRPGDVLRGPEPGAPPPEGPIDAGGGGGEATVPPSPPGGQPGGVAGPPPSGPVAAAQAAILGRVAPKPSAFARIGAALADPRGAWRDFYTNAKNALDPLEQLTKEGPKLSADEDFYKLARLTKGLGGRFQQQLENGTYDITTGRVNGPSLDSVVRPIDDDPDGFTAYALAKRAIELEGRGVKTGMPMPEANTVVAAGAQRFEPVFRGLVGFQSHPLHNLQKSGVISADAVQRMERLNQQYVPYYRLLDPKSDLGQQLGAGGGLQVKNPVYGIKGSEHQVIDPIDSIMKNTYLFTDLAHRNLALQALEDWKLKYDPNDKFMKRVSDVHPVTVTSDEINKFMAQQGIPASVSDAMKVFRSDVFQPADDRIRVFRDGKPRVYEVDPRIGKAVNAMNRESLNMLTRILATPARILRAGAVLSPEFIVRNPVRDQFSALAFSKYGYVPVYDAVRGLGSLFRKDADFQAWLIHGGANSTLVDVDRNYLKLDPKDLGSKVSYVLSRPIEYLRTASELLENATRLGEFKRGIAAGATPTEAAFSSREATLDFARIGAKAQALNAIIPFFNAQVEGVDRAARAFRDDPMRTLTKVGMGITLPSVLMWFANKDDERYQELPAWQKDFFWIVPTDHWVNMTAAQRGGFPDDISKLKNTIRQLPDGNWQRNDGTLWRIPKPFELGVLFGSVPERALDAYYHQNPNAFKDLNGSVISALTPGYVPQAVLPTLEQFANRSLFLDRPLVPQRLQNLPPTQQIAPQTSETAKAISGIISKISDKSSFASPIIIDNYIRQWTGGLGSHVVNLIDQGLAPGNAPPKPTMTAADMPLLRAFAARFPDAGTRSIQDFYETYEDRKQEKAGVKNLQKTGQAADQPWEPVLEGVHKAIGTGFKAINNIEQDRNMSPQDKRAAIDLTYLYMIERAKNGNAIFERTRRQPTLQQAPVDDWQPAAP